MTPLLILGDLFPFPLPVTPLAFPFTASSVVFDFEPARSSDRELEDSPRDLEPEENQLKPFQPDPELPLCGTVRCCLEPCPDPGPEPEPEPAVGAVFDGPAMASRSCAAGPRNRCSDKKLDELDIPVPPP